MIDIEEPEEKPMNSLEYKVNEKTDENTDEKTEKNETIEINQSSSNDVIDLNNLMSK